jgi:nucleotide-binding universal stress UspA family protein
MYNSIVVGYDESEYSKAALAEAAHWTKKHGGEVSLVHAVYFDKEEFVILPSQMEKRFELGAQMCREAKIAIQSELGLNGSVKSVVCEGEAPDVILETAREKHADLIALGTYGRRGLKRLLMGSVTSQVILNSLCDVLVVKDPRRLCTGSYCSLLVPFDGSDSSKKALMRACELVKADGGELTVLYVIPRYEEMVDFFKTESIHKSLFQEAEKITEEAKKNAAAQGIAITAMVQEGHAVDKIVETASLLKNDLIVMGTHGWRGLSKAMLGSTAERTIAYASCPLLVVR